MGYKTNYVLLARQAYRQHGKGFPPFPFGRELKRCLCEVNPLQKVFLQDVHATSRGKTCGHRPAPQTLANHAKLVALPGRARSDQTCRSRALRGANHQASPEGVQVGLWRDAQASGLLAAAAGPSRLRPGFMSERPPLGTRGRCVGELSLCQAREW